MVLGIVCGIVVWFALFLVFGFHSAFGNTLTRLYGRDLQTANLDWVLLLPISATAGVFALLAATITAGQARVKLGRGFKRDAEAYVLTVGISTGVVTMVFGWIVRAIGLQSMGPVFVASGVMAIASLACVPHILSRK